MNKKFSTFCGDPKSHYCFNDSQPHFHFLVLINLVHAPLFYFFNVCFSIVAHVRLDFQGGIFPSHSPFKTLYDLHFSRIHVLCL